MQRHRGLSLLALSIWMIAVQGLSQKRYPVSRRGSIAVGQGCIKREELLSISCQPYLSSHIPSPKGVSLLRQTFLCHDWNVYSGGHRNIFDVGTCAMPSRVPPQEEAWRTRDKRHQEDDTMLHAVPNRANTCITPART